MSDPVVRLADVRATYRYLAHEGRGATEIRIIDSVQGLRGIGYFDREAAFVEACMRYSGRAHVYAGIQPRPVDSVDGPLNTLARGRRGARDGDIEWLAAVALDLDPVRPRNEASTDEQLAQALERAQQISRWIEGDGFIAPVLHMSGNGCQLWFALPPTQISSGNRDELQAKLRAFEVRVRDRFAGDQVAIDSIHNLSRVIKVIGTRSLKGADSPERPHRTSRSLTPFHRREDPELLQAILEAPLPEGWNTKADVACDARPTGHVYDREALEACLCPPARKLWEEGFSDRSAAIFSMVRFFMHAGVTAADIVTAVVEWDARKLGKLRRRNGERYVANCIQRIDATRGPDGAIAPPCRWLRQHGFLSAETPCDICEPLFDVERAILGVPVGLSHLELEARLQPILEDIAAADRSMHPRYLHRIRAHLGLDYDDLKRRVRAIHSREFG